MKDTTLQACALCRYWKSNNPDWLTKRQEIIDLVKIQGLCQNSQAQSQLVNWPRTRFTDRCSFWKSSEPLWLITVVHLWWIPILFLISWAAVKYSI